AYDIYIQKRAALIYRRVEFYKQISYTLLDSDGTLNTDMNLHSGDIVQIQEENEQYIHCDTASSLNGYEEEDEIKDSFEQLRHQLPFNTNERFNVFIQAFTK
ncbi:12208_t:CDS:2, partial [Gigaspora rosea]